MAEWHALLALKPADTDAPAGRFDLSSRPNSRHTPEEAVTRVFCRPLVTPPLTSRLVGVLRRLPAGDRGYRPGAAASRKQESERITRPRTASAS